MFEKVNPSHPDKIADRIAGALVDLAYKEEKNPRIAVEVLIGHGACTIIAETSVSLAQDDIEAAVHRIAGDVEVHYSEYPQDKELARNQCRKIRCGDNGIFRGMPQTKEEKQLIYFVGELYKELPYDGKFILNDSHYIICQSNISSTKLVCDVADKLRGKYDFYTSTINPLGDWTGGIDVDTGATNRKLGSDMGQSITGGGLHGKDLSKADVSISIYAWYLAQFMQEPVEICCAIGDESVQGKPYEEIVEFARSYIKSIGGFEKFAEWGLIRP